MPPEFSIVFLFASGFAGPNFRVSIGGLLRLILFFHRNGLSYTNGKLRNI